MGWSRPKPTPTEDAAQQAQLALANEQNARQAQAWGISLPIYQSLISRYQGLAANPFQQSAGTIESAARQTYGQEQNIMNDLPRGGGQELALAQGRLGLGQFAAGTTNQAREGAYASLAGLSSGLMGQSNTSAGQAGQLYGQMLPPKIVQPSPWLSVLNTLGQAGGTALSAWLGAPSKPVRV